MNWEDAKLDIKIIILLIAFALCLIAIRVYAQTDVLVQHTHISDGTKFFDVDGSRCIYEYHNDSLIMFTKVDYYTQCIECGDIYKIGYTQTRTVIWRRYE